MKNSNEWQKQFIDRLVQSVSVINIVNKLPKIPAGFAIAHQLIRSGTSLGTNFTETQRASSTQDFIQKLSISLRDARETRYW